MWNFVAMGMIAAAATAAAQAEQGQQSAAAELQRQNYLARLAQDRVGTKQRSTPQVASAKCPCCGSRQFVTHHARRVCSYCRSEQDGQPVGAITDDYLAFRSNLAAQRTSNYYNQLSRLASLAGASSER